MDIILIVPLRFSCCTNYRVAFHNLLYKSVRIIDSYKYNFETPRRKGREGLVLGKGQRPCRWLLFEIIEVPRCLSEVLIEPRYDYNQGYIYNLNYALLPII